MLGNYDQSKYQISKLKFQMKSKN